MATSDHTFVLVVDDDADIRTSIRELLEDEGVVVRTAANGLEALEELQRDPHAVLILLDLMMPAMNGWQFMEEQRRDPRLANIPIVLITADAGARDKEARAKAAGYNTAGFLKKPFAADHLVSLVQSYL